MSDKTVIEEMTETFEGMRSYQRARLDLEAVLLINELQRRKDCHDSKLAKLIGRKPRFIKRLMACGQKTKLDVISDIFHALGYSVRITAVPLMLNANPPVVTEER
jgi:hypothetical protein